MVSYDEFRKDALQQYKELPYETNELYKRYYMDMALPDEAALKTARESKMSAEVETLVNSIEKNTRIKFDFVFSNSYLRNNSQNVTVSRIDQSSILEKKLYKNADNKLAAFVNANSRDIIEITFKKGKQEKLNMLFVNDSHLMFQTKFNLQEGATADVFQIYASVKGSDSIVAPLQEFNIEKSAHLEFTMINDTNEGTRFLNLSKGELAQDGKINANFVYNGSSLTKSVGYFDAKGSGSKIEGMEAVYGTGKQRFDINTYLFNSKERTHTRLDTGAVLDGNTQVMLKGYAKVEKWTKGAVSRVNERGIILSEGAHIDALPDMSIDFSDEVSATHSAATSPIDKEALFYMTSRGISEENSRKMFVSSFISKYLSNIQNPSAREIASSIMLSRIEKDGFGEIQNITPKGIWVASAAE